MSVRTVWSDGDHVTVTCVEVTEPGTGLTVMYEVHCPDCCLFDVVDQLSAAYAHRDSHRCADTDLTVTA